VAALSAAEIRASVQPQHRSETVMLPQTCDVESRASIPQAAILSRISATTARQQGSALFCLEAAECVKHELDDAVVAQRRESDDLRCGCNDNPGDRRGEDFFDVHWRRITLALTLAFPSFERCNPFAVFVEP